MTEIAVTGFNRSGKTTFLTSLYWNILHQMDEVEIGSRSIPVLNDFKFIKEVSVRDNSLLSKLHNRIKLNPFYMERKIASFYSGKFPTKSRDSESFAFDLVRDRRNWNPKKWVNPILPASIDLDPRYLFVDFPGERISDVYIVKHKKYKDWAEDILSTLDGDAYKEYRTLSENYRKLLEETSTPLEEIIDAYKKVLVNLILVGSPLVTPSSFKLSEKGVVLTKKGIDSALCGLTKDSQFVPLSDKWENTKIYKDMQAHYNDYRKKLVLPLFNVIDTADVLLVLFDITDILTSGYDSYRSQLEFLDNLTSLCKASIVNPLRLWSVKKVAFIATQSDRVAKSDVENVLSLLKDLTKRSQKKLKNEFGFNVKNIGCFDCTACQSTIEGSEPNTLMGTSEKGLPIHYKVPRIPEYFPKGIWEKTEDFPYLSPPKIRNSKPPTFTNLDKILKFILG